MNTPTKSKEKSLCKNKDSSARYYMKRKLCTTKISIKNVYNLYASADIIEKDREGSHLCHFTRGTYIDLGKLLQQILKEDIC